MKQHSPWLTACGLVLLFFGTASMFCQSPDLAKLFPDIVGWQKKGAVEIFSADNLYEYIDGAAENFLNYDFRQLAVQNYSNAQGQALAAEIYFHGTAENAFGIYSSEKPTGGKYFELGDQGYSEAGILNFICSAYYVKLSGFDLLGNGPDILLVLGRDVVSKIGGKTALPKILQAFPDTGKIPNSERFILNNFLGHDFLRGAFVADYQVQEQKFQLFIIRTASEKEARTMLEKYVVLDKQKSAADIQPGELTIQDPYNGSMHLVWQGKFICGSNSQNKSIQKFLSLLAKNAAK